MPDGAERHKKVNVSDRLIGLFSDLIFYVVTLLFILISLSIEFLTMVFRFSHKPDEFNYLLQASAVAAGIALPFGAWALYNRSSVAVEQFEHDTCGKPEKK